MISAKYGIISYFLSLSNCMGATVYHFIEKSLKIYRKYDTTSKISLLLDNAGDHVNKNVINNLKII